MYSAVFTIFLEQILTINIRKNHMSSTIKNLPPASMRTLEVLDLFLKDPSSKTMKDIAEQLNIPFTSLYRIILCMQEYRYIVEDPQKPNHFQLGYKLSLLSGLAFTEKKLIKAARPVMDSLVIELNQAIQLCVLTSNGVCTIDQRLPRQAMTYITELNETIPINVSASGKILTAMLPEKEREDFLKKAFPRFSQYTRYTVSEEIRFRDILNECKEKKYGIDNEEYALGIGCVAVPIYNHSGAAIAAIGTTGAISFYQNEASRLHILNTLRLNADKICDNLN